MWPSLHTGMGKPGLTSPRTGKCGQTWSTNFFITLKTREWNVRPSCPSICFSKHRAQWIHAISWMIIHHILVTYDGTIFDSTLLTYLRTMEANNALLYPRRTDVCEFRSVVKLFTMAAVAFSKELR